MKLYLIAGTYVGTQAEARAAAKEFGVKVKPEDALVEVPTDKPGLIAYLNSMGGVNLVPLNDDEFTTVVERQDPPVDDRLERALKTYDQQVTDVAVEEHIQNADHGRLCVLFDNVMGRAKELVEEPAPVVREHMGMRIVEVESLDDDELFS